MLYDGGVRLENNYQAVFLCKQIEIIDLRLAIDMSAPFSALITDSKVSVYTDLCCSETLQQLFTSLRIKNLAGSRKMHFLFAGFCRRKNCCERTAVFTSGVTDWATACRTRTERLQKEPPSSPRRPQWPCLTKMHFTSALWTGPSASTPYPERFSHLASSSSTSSTGSPTKCCGTKTSTQTCETQNQNCLPDMG